MSKNTKNGKFIIYLELTLKNGPARIYAYNNISSIPMKKIIEIFDIDISEDPNISDAYFLTSKNYRIHKKYIDDKIGSIDLKVFNYCLTVYSADEKTIRGFYKETLME